MEIVFMFVPLLVLWLASFGVLVSCQLAIAAYRKGGVPDLTGLYVLGVGVGMLFIGQQQQDTPIFAGLLLFGAGFCGFSAGLFSNEALRSSKVVGA